MSNLVYHAFKKPKKLKNGKTVHRWYYYWTDETGKQIQKSCGTKIKSHQAAEDFIRTLPPPSRAAAPTPAGPFGDPHLRPRRLANNPDMLVREIAENMFLPGSEHLSRRRQLKKSVSIETLKDKRVFMRYIIEAWGDRMLRSLELDEVMNYLFAVQRSASWKNQYISVLNEIYQEGQFLGCKIYKPNFPAIGKEPNKADIFTEANWSGFLYLKTFPRTFSFCFSSVPFQAGYGWARLGQCGQSKSSLRKKPLSSTVS